MSSSDSISLISLLNPWPIFANIWRRRNLTWQFALREVQLRHRGSQLGILWTFITPLSMLVLYYLIFGVIYDQRFGVMTGETSYDFLLALFLGLSLFHVFSETLGWAPSAITANPNFVKKVVFPLEVLPVAKICDAAFHLTISLGLVLIGALFGTGGLSWSVLWLPVLVLPLLLLALGIAWALAAIGVFLRDISQVVAFVTTAILFGSAVFYPPSRLASSSPAAWEILRFNPLLQIVDLSRQVVLWHQPISWNTLSYVYGFALIVLLLGHAVFSLLRRSFAEVI